MRATLPEPSPAGTQDAANLRRPISRSTASGCSPRSPHPWVRWHRQAGVDSPKAFLITTVTRLCLDELGSARARREESRSDRLPEPVDLDQAGIGRVEMLDEISMAFLVFLQRLTPAERAVLLLHDVLDMHHAAIGALLRLAARS